ncbi:hypothetical protein [Eleftheria terrae]|uniref:hypothetical protein n=1 Tax=Eleftheria terrae TaxID=1597781 RepID=UPI00263AD03C|nr:hypothetical protein [Eleftheria terrae]WKB53016.1 hypothetical protein N7L95_01015 [Eleftheria terrae]
MKMFRRLMNLETPAEAGGAGGAAAATPVAAPTPPAPAATAASPAPGASGSLLSSAAAPPPLPPLPERIPEKYRVTGADGKLDIEATLAKVEEGRANLEKRLGSGDVRPAAVTDYKVNVPQAMADQLKDWNQAEDQLLQGFLADAHKAGMTQSQVDLVMGKYFDMVPKLAAAGQQLTPDQQAEKTAAELKQVWKDDATFDQNVAHAYRAANHFAAKAGLSYDEIDAAMGNNPAFLRMMAALGPELAEDTSIDGNDAATADWDEVVANLKAEKNAMPERDPRRAHIQAKINAMYEKRYGKQ